MALSDLVPQTFIPRPPESQVVEVRRENVELFAQWAEATQLQVKSEVPVGSSKYALVTVWLPKQPPLEFTLRESRASIPDQHRIFVRRDEKGKLSVIQYDDLHSGFMEKDQREDQ